MKYREERYAQELYEILVERFAFSTASTRVEVGGAGVNWNCTAARGELSCTICCFDVGSPEYYTTFQQASQDLATARTHDRSGTVSAVGDWLAGAALPAFYDRYPFVDARKRSLAAIRYGVLQAVPALAEASQLAHRFGDSYQLNYRAGGRSCEISYYGKNALPDARFAWDDCRLFAFQPQNHEQLAAVLKRWVADRAQPSEMRREFPALQIGTLADYYEQGRPIEGEFIHSWDSIEEFYQQGWCTFSTEVLALLRQMRAAGYHRWLRAGQSMSSLGLSRSRRHGLRTGQASVWFHFVGGPGEETSMNVEASFAAEGLKKRPLQFTSEVRQLLETLAHFDID